MGKQAREEHRRAVRSGKATTRRPSPRGRHGVLWIAGGTVGLVVVALAVGSVVALGLGTGSSAGARQVPAGTAVFPETDHRHVAGTVQYDRTPPAGGAHSAIWLDCGVYTQPVPDVNAVHSLEHGSVWIMYRPDLPAGFITQLQAYVEGHYDGAQRYLILSPYPGLLSPVVASAWGAQLSLDTMGDPRLAAFVAQFEGGAQGGEPGGPCTGGTGTPIA